MCPLGTSDTIWPLDKEKSGTVCWCVRLVCRTLFGHWTRRSQEQFLGVSALYVGHYLAIGHGEVRHSLLVCSFGMSDTIWPLDKEKPGTVSWRVQLGTSDTIWPPVAALDDGCDECGA
jgi:hypothetical protein